MPTTGRSLLATGLVIFFLVSIWLWTERRMTVTVDGIPDQVRTHRRTLAPLLADLGLSVHERDRISLPLNTRLISGMSIVIERARPARVLVDGRDITVYTRGITVADLVQDAGLAVDKYDRVLIDGQPLSLDALLPASGLTLRRPTYDRGRSWANLQVDPMQVHVYRAIPFTVDDGGLPFEVRATAQTVGEALRQAEIILYLGDTVQPSLGSPVTSGLRVFIQRSVPIGLEVDGRQLKTRTQGKTVADALTEMGIGVSGLDQVDPPLQTALYDNVAVHITRVTEDIEIEQEIVPFETIYVADPNILIDTQRLVNPGAEGITRWRYRVRTEDGQEVERHLEDTWVAQEPAQRVIAYGQKIVPNTVSGPNGENVTYWRRIKMFASSYSASTAGVSTSESWYGLTRTGDAMRHGIVAVDPKIVSLRSQVYVPNYGIGDALDTGSAIRARRIDLGYDDSNLILWGEWVDVYLMWPPPPANQITWVLPNWPPLPR